MMTPADVFLVNLFIIAFFTIAVLYSSAAYLLRAMHVHTLTIEAHMLKNTYAKRLEALRYGMLANVEIIAKGQDQELVGVDIIDDNEAIAA